MDFSSESNRTSMSETLNTWRTELSSSFARPEVLFKDLTFVEAKERYGIFLHSQLKKFAITQHECSICHIKGKMKACYIYIIKVSDILVSLVLSFKLYMNNVESNNNKN